jgi:hypothetical protein
MRSIVVHAPLDLRVEETANAAHIIGGLKKAGIQVELVDRAPFRAIVSEPVREALAEKNGREFLTAIEAVE